MEVLVVTHHMQRYAVWFGGSMLASTVKTAHSAHVHTHTQSTHPRIHTDTHYIFYMVILRRLTSSVIIIIIIHYHKCLLY